MADEFLHPTGRRTNMIGARIHGMGRFKRSIHFFSDLKIHGLFEQRPRKAKE